MPAPMGMGARGAPARSPASRRASDAIRAIRLPARRGQDRGLHHGCHDRPAHADRPRCRSRGGRPCWRSARTGTCCMSGSARLPAISSFRIDPATGGLTPQGTVASTHAPTFLAPDRTGRYLLSAYYQGGYAAVHPLGADGAVGAPPCDTLATAMGAHAIQTDPSNQFAFVPHIARFNDNVLEPLRESTGPNVIVAVEVRRPDRPSDAPTHRSRSSPRPAWAPATTAFIPPCRSSIFPTSRGAVSRPIVWTRRRAPSPRCKRSPPCPRGSPPGTPAPRFTSRRRGSSCMWATAATTAWRGSPSTPPPGS